MTLEDRIALAVQAVAAKFQRAYTYIGVLGSLNTEIKTDIVSAINNLLTLEGTVVVDKDGRIAALKDALINGADSEYDTLQELHTAILANTSGLTSILNDVANLVRYDAVQNLASGQKTTACNNISAVRDGSLGVIDKDYRAVFFNRLNPSSLMMHFNGNDNSTIFTDSSSYNRNFLQVSSPIITTSKFKTGNSSLYLNGSSGLYNDQISLLQPFSVNWTLSTWIYKTTSADCTLVLTGESGSGGNCAGWRLYFDSSKVSFFIGYNNHLLYDAFNFNSPISLNTWHHISVVKQGLNYTIYIDGIGQTFTARGNYPLITNRYFGIGGQDRNTLGIPNREFYTGYVDELSIYPYAVYTSNFTP